MDSINHMEEKVPAKFLKMEVEENKQLHKELEKIKKENEQLKKILIGLRAEMMQENKMGNYVEGIRQKWFRPAYKGYITTEVIVKIIHEEGITDLSKIAGRLGVSYSTILRRLKSSRLYPIDKNQIKIYYGLYCQE